MPAERDFWDYPQPDPVLDHQRQRAGKYAMPPAAKSTATEFIPGLTALATPVAGAVVGYVGDKIFDKGDTSSSTATGPVMQAPDGQLYRVPSRRRRRRRRLLTAQDKADIAFLHGQLGGGQLGRAAISSLLSRRMS